MAAQFHIGMKVVCVADNWRPLPPANLSGRLPVKGKVYKICGFETLLTLLYLEFEETPDNWSFIADFFRPVVEKKTDISDLQKLLAPSPRKLETV